MHPRAQLPADNELPAAVAGQIFVSHRIDGGARPLQNGGLVIELVAPLPEQAHPHRLLLSGGHHPEEHRRRLLVAVPVHVKQLDGGGVAAVVDGGVFRPQLAHGGVDGCLKALILLGQGGQGVQLVHRVKHAAVQAQPQHSGQPRQQHPLFHSAAPPSLVFAVRGYYITDFAPCLWIFCKRENFLGLPFRPRYFENVKG